MATKEKILAVLEENKGKWYSGEDLAQITQVSRAAVWKAVKSLQNEGYEISAVTNRGYCLAEKTDILSKAGILKYLQAFRNKQDAQCGTEHYTVDGAERSAAEKNLSCGCSEFYDLQVVPVTGSTNTDVREAAQKGAKEGYVVIAAEQTRGSGRRGRSFYSPSGTGVYISVLLRPENCPAGDAVRITTIAAVAACKSIEDLIMQEKSALENIPAAENAADPQEIARGTGNAPGIKWVNDVYMRGRKVCGILTQGSFDMESALLDYAVMGIGFNVYEPEGGFPEEIANVAGAVFAEKTEDAKNRLCAAFLYHFEEQYRHLRSRGYAEEYRARSIVTGRKIRVLKGAEYQQGPDAGREAEAIGIDDDCRLHVRYEDGSDEWLSSGEISIRLG